ncbi:MAG: hypothetical protein NVS2B16_16690 [Chloroflexota bacterium]
MIVDAGKSDALEHGIEELLQASDGGRQVARVVWDDEHGRRLRAEVEPFGTRFVARLAFWQRARNTWRPADDGLLLSANRLVELRGVLRDFRPWLRDPDVHAALAGVIAAQQDLVHHWPVPGADWLTVETSHIAFHPRGVRITCTVSRQDDRPVVLLHQWRRDESLWLPDPAGLTFDRAGLDDCLRILAQLTESDDPQALRTPQTLSLADDSSARVSVSGDDNPQLCFDQHVIPEGADPGFEHRLSLPLEYAPRFGRALALSWSLLAALASAEERGDLVQSDALSDPAPHNYPNAANAPSRAETPRPVAPDSPPAQEHTPPENDVDAGAGTPTMAVDPASTAAVEPFRAEGQVRQTPQAAQTPDGVADQPAEPPLYVRLHTITLGPHRVALSLQGSRDRPDLTLAWSEHALHISLDALKDLLVEMRALYYDALRGRRGGMLVVGDTPATTIDIDNHGTRLYCRFSQRSGDDSFSLVFPASEVPLFLDAAEAALASR